MAVQALTDPTQIGQIIAQDQPFLLDATAERVGKQLTSSGITNTQIRGVFDSARQIEARMRASRTVPNDLVMLKSKMAYQAARFQAQRERRTSENPLDTLRQWLNNGIDAIGKTGVSGDTDAINRFIRWMRFFEAVLAYQYAAEVEFRASQNPQGGRR